SYIQRVLVDRRICGNTTGSISNIWWDCRMDSRIGECRNMPGNRLRSIVEGTKCEYGWSLRHRWSYIVIVTGWRWWEEKLRVRWWSYVLRWIRRRYMHRLSTRCSKSLDFFVGLHCLTCEPLNLLVSLLQLLLQRCKRCVVHNPANMAHKNSKKRLVLWRTCHQTRFFSKRSPTVGAKLFM